MKNISSLFAKYGYLIMPVIGLIIAIVYVALNMAALGFMVALSNGFFVGGALFIAVALAKYVSNLGVFRSLKYTLYKFSSGGYSRHAKAEFMSFLEYTDYLTDPTTGKRSAKIYYICGFAFVVMSTAVAILSYLV